MSYAWIIDWGNADIDLDIEVKTIGPSTIDNEKMQILKETNEGEKFQMFDDDGMHYYSGRIIGNYSQFEPLDDFGMPNAGCTDIQYVNPKTGEWESL
tara:strand:- start:937 stop:1227 length:291 start_codon:yes stop_codon:yes gene_type:complete